MKRDTIILLLLCGVVAAADLYIFLALLHGIGGSRAELVEGAQAFFAAIAALFMLR